jgi:predicted Ser/Thr protein kinase
MLFTPKSNIGVGSCSRIYEGLHKDRRVALKYGNIKQEEIHFQTLANKANLAPKIYEYNDNVIVMEYIEGPRFKDLILSNNTHLTELYFNIIWHTIFLNQDIGILHGDLHSENIMISDHIVLIDYGSAREFPKMLQISTTSNLFHDLYTISLSILKEKTNLGPHLQLFVDTIQDYQLDTNLGWYHIYDGFYQIHHTIPDADQIVDILRHLFPSNT